MKNLKLIGKMTKLSKITIKLPFYSHVTKQNVYCSLHYRLGSLKFWVEVEDAAFQSLKKSLTNPLVLHFHDFSKAFILFTNASGYAVGEVLMQAHGPIANASRKLHIAKLNYPTHDCEGLALVYCIDKFRCYLQGSQFKVCTDNKALEYLLLIKNITGRQA
jgi:hypothetical protein